MTNAQSVELIATKILMIRGQKVMLDKDLAEKIAAPEKKYDTHDDKIQLIFEAIKQLLEPPPASQPQKPPIGFSK